MPEQYLTPPPPHELLATKSSFYARSGLFFLFVFALAACNGSGGGSSSNDSNNGFSGSLNLSFSNTVIGMREFLLTVSASGLEQTQEIVFIVGESDETPDWEDVKSNKVKITRAFSPSLNKREIYFSATEAYVTNEGGVVDLSTDAETKFPGMMAPKSDYYVHAYASGSYVKSSPKITTADYPASLPPAITDERSAADTTKADNFLRALWGMEMWTRRADGTALNLDDEKISGIANNNLLNMRTIEVKTDEVVYFPFRLIPPYPLNNSCVLSRITMLHPRFLNQNISDDIGTVDRVEIPKLTYPEAGFHADNPSQDQSVLFTKKYSNNYYDIMVKSYKAVNKRLAIYVSSTCIPTTVDFYYPGFGIRQIAE